MGELRGHGVNKGLKVMADKNPRLNLLKMKYMP